MAGGEIPDRSFTHIRRNVANGNDNYLLTKALLSPSTRIQDKYEWSKKIIYGDIFWFENNLDTDKADKYKTFLKPFQKPSDYRLRFY